jgi:DNA ligase-4
MPNYQERPDFYIEPENSIIAEVKAATIIDTSKFSARQTLRFPRLVKFRDSDKVG